MEEREVPADRAIARLILLPVVAQRFYQEVLAYLPHTPEKAMEPFRPFLVRFVHPHLFKTVGHGFREHGVFRYARILHFPAHEAVRAYKESVSVRIPHGFMGRAPLYGSHPRVLIAHEQYRAVREMAVQKEVYRLLLRY